MYRLFILLAIFTIASGEFEELLNRDYTAARKVRKTLSLFNFYIEKENNSLNVVWHYLHDYVFDYRDCHGQMQNDNFFINQVVKKLNTSIPNEVYDVHDIFIQEIERPGFGGQKLDQSDVEASVRWGGMYFHMEFQYIERLDMLKLFHVRCTNKRVWLPHTEAMYLANNITHKMIKNEFVYASGFHYRTCENKTISFHDLVPNQFPRRWFSIDDAISYKTSRLEENFSFSKPGYLNYTYYTRYIQYLVRTPANNRVHLFEINWDTNKLVRGIEHLCEKQHHDPNPVNIGDFDAILHRDFEPAIQIQSTVNRIAQDISNEISSKYISSSCEFVDFDNKFTDLDTFIKQIWTSSSFSLKVMDVQKVSTEQEIGITYAGGVEESVPLYATVQTGDNSMLLKFEHMQKEGQIRLTYARFYRGSKRFQNAYEIDLAMNYIIGLGRNEDVVDFEFVYQNCQNQTIRNVEELTVFPEDAFGITDIVTFQHQNQDFIQFEITVKDRTHYFEINDSKRKFTKGMEYPC